MLVALESVYAVLRSEEPMQPARMLLGQFVEDFTQNAAGTTDSLWASARHLNDVPTVLGGCPAPAFDDGATLVDIDHVDPLLADERPRSQANAAALDLLKLAIKMRRARGWSHVQQAKALLSLCRQVALADEKTPLTTPAGLDALRAIIREEVSRATTGATTPTPSLDLAALREIVSGEVRSGVAAAGREKWSSEPLSVMIEEYLKAQYPTEKGSSQVGSKHRKDVETRLGAFLLFAGDRAVRDFNRDDLKTYRDILDQLPDRFELRFGTKDMRSAIEQNRNRKVPHSHIGPTTVDLKWLGPVNRLFAWMVLEEKIEKNPVDGIRSKQIANDVAANAKRLPLKADQISKLFAITSTSSSKTALYWMPLLLLTTGARPNELAQLRTNDLDLTFNGRPHINVLCLLDDDDEAAPSDPAPDTVVDARRVKTAAGRRMVPLHPYLIEAGFLDFVQERHRGGARQLFRELKADQHGFWSSAITRRINRIIRGKLLITNRKYTTYSLRHNFIDACKPAGIAEETRMKIMGHQLGGVHGIYGNPHVLPHESALIDAISFEGVDFGRYLRRRPKQDHAR